MTAPTMFLLVTVLALGGALAHVQLNKPASRQVVASPGFRPMLCSHERGTCNYEPQSSRSPPNTAPNGTNTPSAHTCYYPTQSTPGPCGDPRAEVGGTWFNVGGGRVTGTYRRGSTMQVQVQFTAFHKGRSQFRICRFPRGKQRGALTESCFSKFVLKQASGAQRGYDWWYHRDSSDQTTTLQLPSNLGCNGSDYRCVLQYRYQAGNSCNPPNTAAQFRNNLPNCANMNSMEQFWCVWGSWPGASSTAFHRQCADVAIN